MRRSLPILIALVLLAGRAWGQGAPAKSDAAWAPLLRNPEMPAYVDTAHVVTLSGGAFRFWLRFDHTRAQPDPSRPGRTFWSVETQEIADCRTQRVSDVRMLTLDRSGAVLREIPPSTRWRGATFEAHPFGREVLVPACAVLLAHQRRRPYPAAPRPGAPPARTPSVRPSHG